MSEFLTFSAEIIGLNEEVQAEVGNVEKAIPDALQFVASEMQSSLASHLREDWYGAWGPPKMYERDTDRHPSRSLTAEKRVTSIVEKNRLLFDYDDRKNRSDGSVTQKNEVIRTIQSNTGWEFQPGTDKNGREIMPRPFWNNFVDEMKNGKIITSFVSGMQAKGFSVAPDDPQRDVQFDGREGYVD